eukprot:1771332-Prymnesium_polylepis.1
MADAERKMCRRGGRKETKYRSNGAIARCGIYETDSKGSELIAESCLSCTWAGRLATRLVDHHDGVNSGQTFRLDQGP